MEINQCPRCKTRFRGEITVCPVDGEALQRLQDPLLGRTIGGRYLIEDKIGGGGMGVVYRASHQVIARDVAIKFLHARYTRDPTSRKRFLGEARAANQINHENIIDITDFGETDDGLVYLVMEYLQGRSLDQELAGRAMSPERALRIAVQIASGLARAHELDVIHRDVKPGNIFLVRRRGGEADYVKLLDFGIARFERELRITDRGALLGTPEYIAPEQVRNGEVSPLTDLYALGCVLFEMLVGRPPFQGNMTEVLVKQMRDQPETPSQLMAAGTPELDALLARMLNKDPRQRHRDAYHLVEDLKGLLGEPAQSRVVVAALSSKPPEPTVAGVALSDAEAAKTEPTAVKLAESAKPEPKAAAEEAAPSKPAEAEAAKPAAPPPPPEPKPADSARPKGLGSQREAIGRLTLHVPVDRDDWGERVASYRRKLTVLHPDAAQIPSAIRESMESMERIVSDTVRLRSELHDSAQALTTSEDDLRSTRLRIGRALDELASDDSKLSRSLEADGEDLAQATITANVAISSLLARPPIGHIALTRGQPLSDEDAVVLQGLALIIESVREANARMGKLQRRQDKNRATLEDVRFQIEQLKGRLTTLNAASSASQSQVQERVQTTETKLRGEMDQLVQEAERVAFYLRTQESSTSSAN